MRSTERWSVVLQVCWGSNEELDAADNDNGPHSAPSKEPRPETANRNESWDSTDPGALTSRNVTRPSKKPAPAKATIDTSLTLFTIASVFTNARAVDQQTQPGRWDSRLPPVFEWMAPTDYTLYVPVRPPVSERKKETPQPFDSAPVKKGNLDRPLNTDSALSPVTIR